MKKKEYVLEERYNEIEDKLHYIQNILEFERRPVNMPVTEQIADFRDKLLGAHDICSIFEDMITCCNRTICIAACALRDLDKIQKEYPDIYINSCIRSQDPATEVAKSAMLLSEFTPAVNERIIYSIYACYDLFYRNLLDSRISDVFDEE